VYHLPQAPENNTKVISKFLKVFGDIRKSRSTTSINDIGGKFANSINITFGTEGKFTTVVDEICGKKCE
jgi:hypothetical protein